MRIISIRSGFATDHSSTSYEFLAVDKPLDREARTRVKALSRRVQPTRRTARFVYNVEGYDIPGGWEPLMRDHYDVMYSESYDWWTLAMAFDRPKEQQEEILKYAFHGVDDMGVQVSAHDSRVIVSIHCRLDPGTAADFLEDVYEEDWIDEEEDDTTYGPDSPLFRLLADIRKQLMAGDYRALYAVWEQYGCEVEEEEDEEESEAPPVPPERQTGAKVVEQLVELLDSP